MRKLSFIASLLILFAGIQNVRSQIEISSETAEKIELKAEPTNYQTEVFAYSNWSSTFRKLSENKGLFGDTLGVRANETALPKWSFGLGFRNYLNDNFAWEGGISLIQNGEKYAFEAVDTLHRYETSYMFIAMPVKVNYIYGKKLKLIASIGLMPQMFMQYRQTGLDVDRDDVETEINEKTKSGYNPFVISAVFNVGVQYNLSDRMSLFLIPEYRLQLNSTYTDKASYIHKATAVGANFGLSIGL